MPPAVHGRACGKGRPCLRVGLCALLLGLAGCGGGLWIGINDGGFDDPPSVSLAVSTSSARVGDTVSLVAAASDDFAIDHVSFFRIEANGAASLILNDATAPYGVDTVVPAGATSPVRYFAQAVDDRGQAVDSAVVSVTLTP